MKQRFGGVVGLLGLAVLFFLLRAFVPALAKLFLILGGVAALGVAALVAVVVFFAFRKPEEPAKDWKKKEQNAVLAKGRTDLMELRRLSMKIRHPGIRKRSEELCGSIDKLLRTLKEHPQDILRVRRFLNESLPMMGNILTTYKKLEDSGVPVEETAGRAEAALRDLFSAMEKQYAQLFEDDVLDMSVEIETLKLVCRRDGLLTGEVAAEPEEEEQGITLTL